MSHAPPDYTCPFCEVAAGIEGGAAETMQDEVVYRDSHVTALISLRQWPNNRGHVIVIPNEHYENLYELPLSLATRIHDVARGTALALKQAYGCEGTSTRQHNEPAGGQDVWHYHVHVFPRYADDNLYGTRGENAPAEDRAAQAVKVRAALAEWKPSEEIRGTLTPSIPAGTMKFARLIPELYCSDLARSLKFYRETLGFTVVFERRDERFAFLERDGAQIMLEQPVGRAFLAGELEAPYGRGVNLQIEVPDVYELYAAVRNADHSISLPLEEKWYRAGDEERGNRQFMIEDPDGYLLRFFADLGSRSIGTEGGPR